MAYSEALWQEAKKKCRLNNEDIKIAKELGINPKSLIKNIPNKNEQWKAPVSIWLRNLIFPSVYYWLSIDFIHVLVDSLD